MANMEKIIRPHLPANIAPIPIPPKCGVPPENTVLRFEVLQTPDSAIGAIGKSTGVKNIGGVTFSKYSHSGTYSHAYKKYMTKQEREEKTETPSPGPSDPESPPPSPGIDEDTPPPGVGSSLPRP